MLDRMVQGAVPRKHHIAFRDAEGRLLYEEAFTRAGFDGPYTLVYHRAPPARDAAPPRSATAGACRSRRPPRGLLKRHYRTQDLPDAGRPAPSSARVPLLFNGDVTIGLAAPDRGGPGLPLERRRRRPLLRVRGRRPPPLAARRSPLRAGRLRLRPEGPPPPLRAGSGPAALALARALGGAPPAVAVAERDRAAPHGRALLAPRLPPRRVEGADGRGDPRARREARRRVPRVPLRRRRRSTWWAGTARCTRSRSRS